MVNTYPAAQDKYPNLDALRSLAVITVMVDHLAPTLKTQVGYANAAVLEWTANIGQAGVLAFFVHTSLVLMQSLARLERQEGSLIGRFYVRRFFRIYPLSVAVVVAMLVLKIPSNTWRDVVDVTPQVIIANLLLIQNLVTGKSLLAPLWSLPYEVQMYLVLPFLFFMARSRRGPILLAALVLALALLGFAVHRFTGRLNMFAYAPCFVCGVLCYSMRNRQRAILPAWSWPIVMGLLFAFYVVSNLGSEPIFWVGWIFCAALGLSINQFQQSRSVIGNWITHRLALYSYGLYLLHVPMLYLVFVVLRVRDLPGGIALYFTLTLLASIVTFHALESPFIKLGNRLSGGRAARARAGNA